MELPKNDHVLFKGNEVLHMDFQDDTKSSFNGCIVTSTGDPDLYDIERSIRRGISHKMKGSYFDVCHLAVELHAMGAKMLKNLVFRGGIEEAIAICQAEFNRKADKDEKFAVARARIHSDWESLKIGEEEYTKSEGGITGISAPTGKIYEVSYP